MTFKATSMDIGEAGRQGDQIVGQLLARVGVEARGVELNGK